MSQEQNLTKNEEVIEQQQPDETVETIVSKADLDDQVEPSGLEKELADVNAKIADLEAQLEAKENRYLRLQADLDNFRRRSRLELEASEKYRAQVLITDLLPALDNFERALSVTIENDQTKAVLQGIEMVYKSLLEALKKEGVEPIDAVGQEFDPHRHQAVMQVEEPDFGSNVVVEEFQKGYILKDRVIRPSMVKVNQ